MPLNAPGKWKYFISYQQTSTIAEAMVIAYELGKDDCWLDSGMEDYNDRRSERTRPPTCPPQGPCRVCVF